MFKQLIDDVYITGEYEVTVDSSPDRNFDPYVYPKPSPMCDIDESPVDAIPVFHVDYKTNVHLSPKPQSGVNLGFGPR